MSHSEFQLVARKKASGAEVTITAKHTKLRAGLDKLTSFIACFTLAQDAVAIEAVWVGINSGIPCL